MPDVALYVESDHHGIDDLDTPKESGEQITPDQACEEVAAWRSGAGFLAALVGRRLAVKTPGANLRWPGRTLRLADGTCVSKPASKGTDWRVHGVFDLGSGGFSHLELTDQHGAEALERGAPIAGEIRIGDRNYARVPVLKRFLTEASGKADFIVRLGWNALQLSTPRGKSFDLIGYLQHRRSGVRPHEVILCAAAGRGESALPLRPGATHEILSRFCIEFIGYSVRSWSI
jgi:hypothetical protein